MKFFTTAKLSSVRPIDALVVFVFLGAGDVIVYPEELKENYGELYAHLKKTFIHESFQPIAGNVTILQSKEVQRVICVGCGLIDELVASDVQDLIALASMQAKRFHIQSLGILIPQSFVLRFGAFLTAEYAIWGVCNGTYAFLQHKNRLTQRQNHDIAKTTLIVPHASLSDTIGGIARGVSTIGATFLARDLVNEPSSTVTPTYLGKIAKSLKSKKVTVSVFNKKQIRDFGMHAFLGVSKGSVEEPKFIKLSYRGGGKKTICVVGKGITYDSGGLSLKSQSGLETMKCDMAGAAAVLGIFQALSVLRPNINVVGLIAACENMPSGTATKPGDIVTAMNGKTIEIVNTDAEGRLILADALSYAEKYVHAEYLIDLATLTGACMVALGEKIAGIFSDDDTLAEAILQAGLIAGEKFWRLPLAGEYQNGLLSAVADIRNVSTSKYGGAINGALFLKEFVSKGRKWAHLDIAGPAYIEPEMAGVTPGEIEMALNQSGGTGFGVRTLLSFIEAQAKRT